MLHKLDALEANELVEVALKCIFGNRVREARHHQALAFPKSNFRSDNTIVIGDEAGHSPLGGEVLLFCRQVSSRASRILDASCIALS